MGKDLTILILSHNRQIYLLRLLFFLKTYDLKIKILILDSSNKNFDNQSLIKIINENKIKLFKFKENIPLKDKISIGSKKVTTKYCVLSADDDFLIPHALIKCVEFLEKNRDYSSAHGYYFYHTNYETIMNDSFNVLPLFRGNFESNNSYSSFNRVHDYLKYKKSCYPVYAVHKTENFKKIHQFTQEYTEQLVLHEYFQSCASLIIGKMKILPIFYCSREPNSYQWESKNKILEYLSSDRIEKASIGLSKLLVENDKIIFKDSFNSLKNYFETIKSKRLLRINKNEHLKNSESFFHFEHLKSKLKKFLFIKLLLNIKKYILFQYRCFSYNINKNDLENIKSSILLNKDLNDELNNIRRKY